MQELILLIIAIGALCCMATNTVMIFSLLRKPEKPAVEEPEKTPEEKERERIAMENQRLMQEGLENMMAFTGFGWKNGGKSQ